MCSHSFFARLKKRRSLVLWLTGLLLMAMGLWYALSLPASLFEKPYSTVLEDRDGLLLGARIAPDGQWRFPPSDSLPRRFTTALIAFEDRHFYRHPGVNPFALARAMKQNLQQRRIVSGGSTLSMQLIRLLHGPAPRNLPRKLYEMLLAARLELRYSKDEILRLYAAHAPFGGNVVGLEAASWRYFGHASGSLSWAEAACLAVLPNAPSLVFPGRQQELLLRKRNELLQYLAERGHLDETGLKLALAEPLPGATRALPMHAPHLLDAMMRNHSGQRIKSSLDAGLQFRALDITDRYHRLWRAAEIHNAAVLMADLCSGEVLVYIGNTRDSLRSDQGHSVDMVRGLRSTGSLLKPFLYAAMMAEGDLLPGTLVADIPTRIGSYSPTNYFLSYDGAVPAAMSLSRSLNVPSVRMLRDYGLEKFHHQLRQLGMHSLNRPPGHYGLSLMLGGAESSLWQLGSMYARFSQHLLSETGHEPVADGLKLFLQTQKPFSQKETIRLKLPPPFDAASVWLTWEALLQVNRPDAESSWEHFESGKALAWKTGTSFGGRDAWAIGTNAAYLVGVWVGNASGEGRPGLSGYSHAAPLMFALLDLLPDAPWFPRPYDNLALAIVCRESGHLAGRLCPETDSLYVHEAGLQSGVCPYHRLVHLDASGQYQVHSECEEASQIQSVSWFVLSPAMEWFYRRKNAGYRPLPPYRDDCLPGQARPSMEMIYPQPGAALYLPRQADGKTGNAILEVAHRRPESTIHWHLDGQYMGSSRQFHQLAIRPPAGFHRLTLVDEHGDQLEIVFEVVNP